MDEYPTKEQLIELESWSHEKGFEALAEYVLKLWHFSHWAILRKPHKDEFGTEYKELRLATAGWSGNEEIVSALMDNTMFRILCWQSSHRGGLHIFHIPTKSMV